MERAHSFLVILLFASLCLCPVSCGEHSESVTLAGTTPLTLTMSDEPPAGLAVLSFEVTVKSAVLQPGNISLLSTPTDIEVSRLEVETAFLNATKAPSGTYSSLTVTFGKPEITILNNSGAPLSGCLAGRVCELKPALLQTSVTYSGSPFPLTINSTTPVGLVLDLDLMKSIQGDLSVNPAITLTQISVPSGSDHSQDIDDTEGEVTAVNATQNQFTVQVGGSAGRSITVNVDARTLFEDFDEAGLTNAISSISVGQVVEVDAALRNDGSLVAKQVELEDGEESKEGSVDGLLVSINSPIQFTIIITDETRDTPGLEIGNSVLVTIQDGVAFDIDEEDLAVPPGFRFATSADLMPGQRVSVHPVTAPAGSPLSLTADHVRLDASHLTARIQSIADNDFVVDNLPSLFSSAVPPITSIEVRTSSATDFENVPNSFGLAAGDTVSMAGLLFKTDTRPLLMADKIRKR
jgi:Domain of unknown function (DUF5666)